MSELGDLIKATAEKYALDVELFASLIIQESSLNQWAFQYEDGFYRQYLKHLTLDQMPGRIPHPNRLEGEKRFRSASWGYTQILGETARELGFVGEFLTELLDPAINIEYGAKYLAKCFKRHSGDEREALLAYNGGKDLTYPDRVFARKANGEYKTIL